MKNTALLLLLNLTVLFSTSFSLAGESKEIREDKIYVIDDVVMIYENAPRFMLLSSGSEDVIYVSCSNKFTNISSNYIVVSITDRAATKKVVSGYNDQLTAEDCRGILRSFISHPTPFKLKVHGQKSRHISNYFMGSHKVDFLEN